ncbi:hypothetical protein ACOJBO_22600 [Rhizobium beringeri]
MAKGIQQVRTPDLALHNRPIQVFAVADLRIGCIARLCLNVAPLHFGKPQALRLPFARMKLWRKFRHKAEISSMAQKRTGRLK